MIKIKKNNILKLVLTSVVFILLLISVSDVNAQCSMCKAVAESGAEQNTTNVVKGLNQGILYLLSIPYVLGGVAFFIWRKNRKKQQPAQS